MTREPANPALAVWQALRTGANLASRRSSGRRLGEKEMNQETGLSFRQRLAILFFILAVSSAAAGALGQQDSSDEVIDPGPRIGGVGAGGFLMGLTDAQQAQANDGAMRFVEPETFPGGLGPFYNSGTQRACGGCHAQPNVGGSSPSASAYPYIGPNPQATVDYNAYNASNVIPPFISADGPVREMRLVYFHKPNGNLNLNAPDGGVHDLYNVTGRTDNTTCTLPQPNFAQELAQGNAIFRIPTPVFGAGLIENIDDGTILANQAASQAAAAAAGIPIAGQVNRNGNDGTISRFGWKAQNKSLLIFAGEAYNVEDGVTNELFPTQRPTPGTTLPPGCLVNATPEDRSNPESAGVAVNSDVTAFAAFMRMLAPPTPAAPTAQTLAGQQTFSNIGCALCHTPTMTTAQSTEAAALSGVPANLYSDLLIHNMGDKLADGVSQGGANGQQFRSAPLWGVGQRVFFLHDGRTSDLAEAIRQHKSHGSEANQVIDNFENLSHRDKKNLLLFLRSL
jgi:Di-haem oxidoreductase, putative peroxidase